MLLTLIRILFASAGILIPFNPHIALLFLSTFLALEGKKGPQSFMATIYVSLSNCKSDH